MTLSLSLFVLTTIPTLARPDDPIVRATPLDAEAPFRRFLWVTRWDYRSADDIERICYNAASARFTDLLFQVRGEGTVFFSSPMEPWAWELSGLGPERGVGVDPGWDPLAVAIREARRRGLRIHAYVNVLPAWAQKVRPHEDSGQLSVSRRSWLMVDRRGRRMEPKGFYSFLDPGLPEVRDYLARLIAQLARDYAVDGIHLDYIRYPHEAGDFSYHPRVVKDFEEWYGRHPDRAPEKWKQYKQRQIMETIGEIRKQLKAVRPGIELSASVMANPEIAGEKAAQLPLTWLDKGLVDAIAPMVYVEDMPSFSGYMDHYKGEKYRSRVWLGIRAVAKNHVMFDEIAATIAAQFAGVAIFSYSELFGGHKPTRRAQRIYESFVKRRPSAGSPAEDRKRRRLDLKVKL